MDSVVATGGGCGYISGMIAVVAVLVFLLVFLAGYATQRGGVCAVAATEELVVEGKANRYVGFLFCAACGLAVMAIGNVFGQPVLDTYSGLPISAAALVGGAVVGIGAYVNGRCAFGTVAELGRGSLPRIATLGGFILGSALGGIGHLSLAGMPRVASPLTAVSAETAVVVAVCIVASFGLALMRLARPRPAPEWTPLQSMAVIGISNGVLLVLAQGWPYTSLLMEIALGGGEDVPRRGFMAVVFVFGAIVGGSASGQFQLRVGGVRDWLRALAGGAIMGIGAVFVPGGNDAMLLVGLPLLLPNLVAAYLAMSLVLLMLVAMRARVTASGW